MLATSRIMRPIGVVVLSTFLFQMAACTSAQTVALAPREAAATFDKIIAVQLKDGRRVAFDRDAEATLSGDSVIVRLERGWGDPKSLETRYAFALSDVDRVLVEHRRFEGGKTALAVVGVLVLTAAAASAVVVASSCPFVYSWDGTRYVLDAEPYGGAVTRGLERDDYSLLEHLAPTDETYRLRMTNENDERQYTDLLEIWIVDHPAGIRVVPDEFGRLHTVATPLPATSALADGRDIRAVLASSDWRIYEPTPDADPAAPVRAEVLLTVP